jgi:hypothetical protein
MRRNCIFYGDYDKIFLLKDKYIGLYVRITLLSLKILKPNASVCCVPCDRAR